MQSLRFDPLRWQHLLVAGSGLGALRAGQACSELGLVWYAGGCLADDALIARARELDCDALHPGEATAEQQRSLARACASAGLAFVGSGTALLDAMCDGDAIRHLMRDASLPLAEPASSAPCVHLPVLADDRGQALALVEHERIADDFAVAPSERLTPEQRAYLGQLAVQGARALGLVGLATLTFTLDNNRLGFVDVRPGLTGFEGLAEVLSGLDLAVEQVRLVRGERLRRPRVGHMGHGPGRPGHAGLRLLPLGKGLLCGGPGVRLDRPAVGNETWVRLLVWGRDAAEARRRERRALAEWHGDVVPGSGEVG